MSELRMGLLSLIAISDTCSVWAGPTWHVAGGNERFAALVRLLGRFLWMMLAVISLQRLVAIESVG